MWNTLFKPLLPYFAAIGIFVVISMVYFIPEIFQNKTMITVDGMGGMGAGKEASDYQKQTGKKNTLDKCPFRRNAYLSNISKLSKYQTDLIFSKDFRLTPTLSR